MKYLVTGTAGFIGFHVAKKLIEKGEQVVGLDSINDYYDINLKYARLEHMGIEKEKLNYGKVLQSNKYPEYSFIQLDLTEKEKLSELFKAEKFDVVIHLAAQAGVRYSLSNPFSAFLRIL